MSAEFEVGDKVTFRQSDSFNTSTGTITEIDTIGGTGVYDPVRYRYWVRDDLHGWLHGLYATDLVKTARVAAKPASTWDGPF